jgi:hypothetical protein
MKSFELIDNIIESALREKKYNVISECSNIINPDKCNIVCESYSGDGLRVFKRNGNINILIPQSVSVTESEYLSNAIKTGEIFDDAENVTNAATYVVKTTLPVDSMINQRVNPPVDALVPTVGSVIGKVDEEGIDIDETDINNGHNMIKDIVSSEETNNDVDDVVSNYLSIKDNGGKPMSLKTDVYEIKNAMKELEDYDDDEPLPDEDCIDCEIDIDDDDDDKPFKESFLSKKPKRLKPIDARGIISYVTIQKNAIRDTNDQAMLSGYICSKLETADFYVACIDNNDGKYIVPHDRAYLINYINQMNRLLTEVLKLKPINKLDRVWQVNVNYPEGWKG